jgi:L-fuculose-phosphate aldolase
MWTRWGNGAQMAVKEKDVRLAMVAATRALNASDLNIGTAGNISVRLGDKLLITPSAVPYDKLRPEMMAAMPLGGEYGAWSGPMKPSSEWRFHLDIIRARADIGAVVHFHPPYGCALAMLHKPILAAHYMIALFGGPIVKCTKYAPYGTKELADLAVEALGDRHAVLLGNHGALTTAATLAGAMNRALELETLARMYYMAIAAGRPAILSDDEVMRTVERFKSYGGGVDAPFAPPAAPKKRAGKAKTSKTAKTAKTAPRKKKVTTRNKKTPRAAPSAASGG